LSLHAPAPRAAQGATHPLHVALPIYRAVAVDVGVHQRLRVARLVALVVAVLPVADEVNDDVLVEDLAVVEGQAGDADGRLGVVRSEEHTSELQSRGNLVWRLMREQKS